MSQKLNLSKAGTITNSIQTNVITILNDIINKNFTLAEIKTNDCYSLEYNLVSDIESQLNRQLQSIQKIYLLDANSVRTLQKETVIEYDPVKNEDVKVQAYRAVQLEIPQALRQIIGTPNFPILFLKEKDKFKENTMLIIKDFDLLFKNRKEQLKAYHLYESEMQNLIDHNNKIVFVSKEAPKSLYEAEINFVSYNYSNEDLRKYLIKSIGEAFPEKFKTGFDLDKLTELTANETLLGLKNLLKEDYSSSEELLQLMEQKKMEEIMERNPEIKIKKPTMKLSEVIGLNNAKNFISKGMEKRKIKSVMLVGVGGTGKTALCEALAEGFGLPLIEISFTNTASKYVGESEKNTKRVLNALKGIKEAVIYFDEIEKQIAGGGATNSGDSGVGTKVMGELLKFLQERKEGRNLVLFTANNIDAIRQNCPELLRAGRIDASFYVDFPTEDELESLCELYAKKFNSTEEPPLMSLASDSYTGAEVATLYRLSNMLDISLLEAKAYIKPISKTYNTKYKDEFMRA